MPLLEMLQPSNQKYPKILLKYVEIREQNI